MGQVITANVWLGQTFVERGTCREDVPADVVDMVSDHLWTEAASRDNVSPSGEALSGLKANVWIAGAMYAKGSIPPADVIPKVGTHMWVQGFSPPAEVPPGPDSVVTEDGAAESDPESAVPAEASAKKEVVGFPPNKGGKDSSAALWLAYAEANQVEVHAKAERAEIIAALTEAGVPTD